MIMRYARAVERLRLLADACQATTRMPLDNPFLHEAYVFGEILEGVDPIECLTVAFTLNLSPDDVPWCSRPRGTAWLVHDLRLDSGGIEYWWRSRHEPVGNHIIRNPVRLWSLNGTDETALRALQDHRFSDLHRVTTTPAEAEQHSAIEFSRALNQLRTIHQDSWTPSTVPARRTKESRQFSEQRHRQRDHDQSRLAPSTKRMRWSAVLA